MNDSLDIEAHEARAYRLAITRTICRWSFATMALLILTCAATCGQVYDYERSAYESAYRECKRANP